MPATFRCGKTPRRSMRRCWSSCVGSKPDVVLVHGLGMSSRYFDRFARALVERGYRPIAPDLPGFGDSPNAPAGGPEEHAAFLAEYADANAIRETIWIGHSLGCNA